MLKRISIILALAIALTFAFSGVAMANFGPHGGYSEDTDACAGCHRAHTSFSTVEWTDAYGGTGSALLIGSADEVTDFCAACHGDDAPGAATNVISGVFDGGPSGADGVAADGASVLYETNSSFNATLNAGGFVQMPVDASIAQFEPVSSLHGMDEVDVPLWGDGNFVPTYARLNCTSCHDVHGSSNYRLLKDSVNGNTVGGYDNAGNPDPFVISAEEGYPTSGWFKHESGAAQMESYKPNYTSPEYRNRTTATRENMSGWCAGCHERYIMRNDASATTEWLDNTAPLTSGTFSDVTSNTYDYNASLKDYNSALEVGEKVFHRHPNNISLAGGDPTNFYWLNTPVTTDTVIPLEWDGSGSQTAFRNGEWDYTDYLGCLTCHRAHGTSTEMTGWAEAQLETTDTIRWYPRLNPGSGGVPPANDSALLRADNRGVCERCHNK